MGTANGGEPLRVKTGSGVVTVTDESVIVEAAGGRDRAVRRAAITGVDSKTSVPSFFGLGGARQITIRTSGENLVLRVVRPKDAARLLAVLR